MSADGVYLDEPVALPDLPEPTLCPWCLGSGSVRVPPVKRPSAFGPVAREAADAIPCPLCGGRGRR